MPFDTFPIPAPAPTEAQVNGRLDLQGQALMGPVQSLADAVNAATATTSAQLKPIVSKLKRSAAARNSQTLNQLTPVVASLMNATAEATSQNAAVMATNPVIQAGAAALAAPATGAAAPATGAATYTIGSATIPLAWAVQLTPTELATITWLSPQQQAAVAQAVDIGTLQVWLQQAYAIAGSDAQAQINAAAAIFPMPTLPTQPIAPPPSLTPTPVAPPPSPVAPPPQAPPTVPVPTAPPPQTQPQIPQATLNSLGCSTVTPPPDTPTAGWYGGNVVGTVPTGSGDPWHVGAIQVPGFAITPDAVTVALAAFGGDPPGNPGDSTVSRTVAMYVVDGNLLPISTGAGVPHAYSVMASNPSGLAVQCANWWCLFQVPSGYVLCGNMPSGTITAVATWYVCPVTAVPVTPPATVAPPPTPAPTLAPTPVAPPPAPPPHKVQTLKYKCDIDFPTQIAPPGSPEWCAGVNDYLVAFASAGNTLFEWLDVVLNPAVAMSVFDTYQKQGSLTNPLGYIADNVVYVLGKVVAFAGPAMELLHDMIVCARNWIVTAFARCNVAQLVALIGFRIFLESLHKVRAGCDAAVWATIDAVIAIPPLEESLDALIKYVCPQEAPSPGEATEAWLRGYITEDLLACIYRLNGRDYDSFRPYIMAASESISGRETIEYTRRMGGDADDEVAALRKVGWVDPVQIKQFQTLYDELPSIGDILEWLRKNVFDHEYVTDFRLMEGFEEKFWPAYGQWLRARGMTKEFAGNHYAAHWLNPSTGQLFEMSQRLRPGRVSPEMAFSKDDLLRVLQEQDIGPYFRDRLEMISHPAMNIGWIVKVYVQGGLSDDELLDRIADIGYDETTAPIMRDAVKVEAIRIRTASAHGWTPTALARAYAQQTVTKDFVYAEMGKQGFTKEYSDSAMDRAENEEEQKIRKQIEDKMTAGTLSTIQAAYECGNYDKATFVTMVQAAGGQPDVAAAWADQLDARIATEICAAQVAALKKAVMKGKVTLDSALATMVGYGMPALRANQNISKWRLDLAASSPSATAATILRWVASGLMPSSTAVSRLGNLGWSDPDLTVMLAESMGKLSQRNAKTLAMATKSQAAAAKAAAKAIADAKAQISKLQHALKGIASVSTLTKWYAAGLIDQATFEQQMLARGYPQADVTLYFDQAKAAKAKVDAKATGS